MGTAKLTDPVHENRPKLAIFVESLKTFPKRLVIMTEGDSWFSYPINRNIVDYLEMMRDFSILRLEHSGDEARDILKPSGSQLKKIREYLKRYPFELLMFSGGGNDIAGKNFPSLLKTKFPGTGWQDCIDQVAFEKRLEEIAGAYEELLKVRDTCRPKCAVVAHCYDYAVPANWPAKSAFGLVTVGPWLHPHFVAKGIDPKLEGIPIVRYMIDQLQARLAAIAADPARKFHIVDTRRTLIPADKVHWADEMHPSGEGAALLAAQWRLVLAKLFPGRGF